MTKEEIHAKAVDNAKKYEVWPPAADYQDGLIKGFEDGAEWMLDDPTGGALLYAVVKTTERTKREMIEKAVEWLYVYYPTLDKSKSFEDAWKHFKQAMEE